MHNEMLSYLCTILLSYFIGSCFAEKNKQTDVKRQRGVIIERWDGIDGYLVRKLLADSRFPDMPTIFSYSVQFAQPSNWGTNYGSRIRGYFVPRQTGPHIFFIASDSDTNLYLSTTNKPSKKVLICRVKTSHDELLPTQFTRYPHQRSFPIELTKSRYYYIEALYKEQYANDHLSVAVKTPDGKFYAPIPSQFLWTAPPHLQTVHKVSNTAMLTIAAKAGAKAGASLGMKEAEVSGKAAGAIAGAEAGQMAGAAAGAKAAAKAATAVVTKTLKAALVQLRKLNKPIVNIFPVNGSVVTQPSGVQIGASGSVTPKGGAQGAIGIAATSGAQAGISAGVESILTGKFKYNRQFPYHIPPKSAMSFVQGFARYFKFLNPSGYARVIVNGGIYVVHSMDIPATQDPSLNLCWQITHGKLEITQNCQAFIAHIPGFNKGKGEHQTISFESACIRGYYIRQKNYRFVLDRKDSAFFGHDASFYFNELFTLPGAFQFSLWRKGWYMCHSIYKSYHRVSMVADYNEPSSKWLQRCSFVLRPLGENENVRMNCLDFLVQPSTTAPVTVSTTISNPPKTTSTLPKTRPLPTTSPHKPEGPCISLYFVNNAGITFMLHCSLKPEGYLVRDKVFHLRYTIRNNGLEGTSQSDPVLNSAADDSLQVQQLYLDEEIPDFRRRQIVSFWAEDPTEVYEILLDGREKLYLIPGFHCDVAIHVYVTSRKKISATTRPPKQSVKTKARPPTTSSKPQRPTTPPSLPSTFAPSPPAVSQPPLPAPPPPLPPPPAPILPPAPLPPPVHPPPPPRTHPTALPPSLVPSPLPPSPLPPSPSPTLPTKAASKTIPPCAPEVPHGLLTTSTLRPCSRTAPQLTKLRATTPKPPPKLPPPVSKPSCTPPGEPKYTGGPPPCPITSPPKPLPPVSASSCSPPRGPNYPGAPPSCGSSSITTLPPYTLPTLPPIRTQPLIPAGCMLTHGGTSHGACCMFPFLYHGELQHRCTRSERGFRWCATTSSYDNDNQWGFCSSCFLCHGGNSNGNCCHFPFIYGGKMYVTCTVEDETRPWCATTYNFDTDKQWGYCAGDAPGSVPQPKVAYAPCSFECDNKCVDTCPDYCCVKAMKDNLSASSTQPAVMSQPGQIPMEQLTIPCPAICSKFCVPHCPVHCCNLPLTAPAMLRHSVTGCTDGFPTTGGNANGACCYFPFIYKGLVYWKCTSQDAETNWCSVRKVFDVEKKWGFCL